MFDPDKDAGVEPRGFQETDREGLICLWSMCDLLRPWNNADHDIDRKLDQDPRGLIVLELYGTVVGSVMAGYDGHRGWVNYLAVHPDRRSQGLGRLLMAAAEDHLTAVGCPKVNLQIRSSNPEAIGFYRRLGYVPDDVVSMGKRLDDAGR
jgi:ribosomal protein S18 acetylase RimI-like enzyme